MSETALAGLQKNTTKAAVNQVKPTIQRKCACGQHTIAGGECESCRKKRLKLQRWKKGHASPPQLTADYMADGTTRASHFDADLTAPKLRTYQPLIQKLPQGEAVSAPEETAEQTIEATPPSAPATTPAEATPTPETAAPTTETAAPGLLVADNADELDQGQMRKTEFLAELRTVVCAAADAELAAVGRDTEGCPYLDYWFDYYAQRDAAHIESALSRYAPQARTATSARDYIPLVAERVRQGVARWARTGEISGVPEGVSTAVPGQPPAESGSAVQAKARPGGARPDDDPQAIQEQLGNGRPLDSGVRSRMESAFGTSFGHVRLHNDNNAAHISSSQNARAFTVGQHVAFGAGEYQPGTMLGDALIAHELAHVVQQGSGSTTIAPMQTGGNSYNLLEDDADKAAMGAVTSLWGNTKGTLTNIAQDTMPSLRSGLRLQRCATTNSTSQTVTTPNQGTSSSTTGSSPCGQSSKASTYTPTSSGIGSISLGSGEFGTTSKLAAQFTYGACQDGGSWHFYLDTLTVRIGSAVQPVNFRTNVTSANDSIVTSSTHQAIANDLRPNRTVRFGVSCAGNRWVDSPTTYSRRRNYWNHQFVVDHEGFHRRDWDSKYRPNLINAEQRVWSHTIPSTQASSANNAIQGERSVLDRFMIDAYQETCRQYTPQQETRAYDDGASNYQGLVDAIEGRAQSEGW